MTTILSIGNSESTRRCDATCHDAAAPRCACICGGRYHGKGREEAEQLIQEDARTGRLGEHARAAAEAPGGQLSLTVEQR